MDQIISETNGLSEKSNLIKVNDPKSIKIVTKLIESGDVVAVPTDTVYGLACLANNSLAIQRLYEVKGRAETKPVSICVATISDLKHWSSAEHLSDRLLNKLLPGPVTIVLKRSVHLNNPDLNGGIEKIGIRIPDYPFIQEICHLVRVPIALTSANRSSEPSTLNIGEFRSLWQKLGAVVDAGQLGLTEAQRAASTVVDLSDPGRYSIIRSGVAVQHTEAIMREFGIVKAKIVE